MRLGLGLDLPLNSLQKTSVEDSPSNIYWTDFSEYTTDAPPSDWSVMAESDFANLQVKEDINFTGGKYLNLEGGGLTLRNFITWDAVPDATDVEILVRYKILDAQGEPYATVRLSGTTVSNLTAYRGGYRQTSDSYRISGYNEGSFFPISSGPTNSPSDLDGWLRVRIIGNNLKLKIWVVGNSEPAGWNIDSDDSTISGAGKTGLHIRGAGVVNIDIFSVAINGEEAPMEKP